NNNRLKKSIWPIVGVQVYRGDEDEGAGTGGQIVEVGREQQSRIEEVHPEAGLRELVDEAHLEAHLGELQLIEVEGLEDEGNRHRQPLSRPRDRQAAPSTSPGRSTLKVGDTVRNLI
ncbi:hypothetical protein FRC01_010059, partial [Tulasnella sp. 417]